MHLFVLLHVLLHKLKKNHFDINSLLTRRENISNAISIERNRIIHLRETKF
jgi:hypothetical protein